MEGKTTWSTCADKNIETQSEEEAKWTHFLNLLGPLKYHFCVVYAHLKSTKININAPHLHNNN